MKIFAAGMAHESNSFVSEPTTYSDYLVQRGAPGSPIDYPSQDMNQTWGKQATAGNHAFIFSLMAWAQPGGINTRGAYEALRDEMLTDLRAALPVDIVLLHLHGAMIAQGYEDCEADILKHVRALVGPETVVGVELDLHCHLTEAKISAADIVVLYKEYPHTDMEERGAELFDLAVAAKTGRIKPVMALFDCGMVGLYATTREPMRGFVDQMSEAERRPGILSVSLGHGFQFADLPGMGAKMLAVADGDRQLAAETARAFGLRLYELRHEIGFENISLPLEDALSRATSNPALTIVADQSDNPGLGSPGDSTVALRWLVEHRVGNAGLAILHDPEVVKIAKKAGTGATIQVRLGGKTGPSSGDPLDLEVEVRNMLDGYMHPFPQDGAEPAFYPAGDIVALRCGGVEIVVGSKRCQCFSPAVFTALGIDPAQKSVLVVKSTQHFYSAFASIADDIIYMATPGAAPPDPRRIDYKRFDPRHVYPWAQDR